MRRWRVKTHARILAERVVWCVVAFAVVNWMLNVCHYHWTIVLARLRVSTWAGCLEVRWQFAQLGDAAPESRAYFTPGGVVGRNGLATVLGHIRWLPSFEILRPGPTAGFERPHATVLLPMWSVGVGSAIPITLLALKNRRRRRERLCERCEYPIGAIPRTPAGTVVCPECGFESAQLSGGPTAPV